MASPSKARAITNRRDSAIRRDSLKLFVAAAERKVQRRDSQAPIFSSPKNGASDLECFDSDAHDVVHVDNVQEIRGSEVTAFETHYKFRHTRSLSIIKYNDSTNDQAVRTNRCSGISTRYRLQTKSIMWAAAAASASIYSMDPVSLIGNYLIYCSSVFRAARLGEAIRASSQVDDDPTVDSRIELLANRLLTLQHSYYVVCAAIVLSGQALWWSYPHDGFVSQMFLGHIWNAIDGLSSPFSFFFLIRECQERKRSRGSGSSHTRRVERRATLTKVEAKEAEGAAGEAERAKLAKDAEDKKSDRDAKEAHDSRGSELGILGEHLYSVLVNGAMLCLAIFSMCVGRSYGALDFALFSASMAYGCIEPIRHIGRIIGATRCLGITAVAWPGSAPDISDVLLSDPILRT
jgi:hypothetical protein